MIPIIGGKLDGQESPLKVVTMEAEGEPYILMEWQEKLAGGGKVNHRFYMVIGMSPVEAVERYKVLRKFDKLK